MAVMHSNPSSTEIHAVLFDYGLVLTGPPHPPAWERMKTVLDAGEQPFHAAYWRWRHDYDLGVLTAENYWHKVAQDVGRSPSPEQLQTLIEADIALWTEPNPPMIAWAAALQAAGVRTGILSNIGDAMETGILDRCPWLRTFDHLTFSHRLRIAKPDPSIYAHAAHGLGVHPQHVLFIDDRKENVEGALRAGMQAIQYTDHPAFERAMQAAAFNSLLAPATKV